jgi:hypothetical protein
MFYVYVYVYVYAVVVSLQCVVMMLANEEGLVLREARTDKNNNTGQSCVTFSRLGRDGTPYSGHPRLPWKGVQWGL